MLRFLICYAYARFGQLSVRLQSFNMAEYVANQGNCVLTCQTEKGREERARERREEAKENTGRE